MIDLAACREFCERRNRARQFANVGDPIPVQRPMPVLAYQAPADDIRPPALSRGPCLRCETRGDIGCAHQRPYEPVKAVEYRRNPPRWAQRL